MAIHLSPLSPADEARFLRRHIGRCIREFRRQAGLRQTHIAEALGCCWQNVHKIEHGKQRVSADQLYRVSIAVGRPVSDFFAGLGEGSPL